MPTTGIYEQREMTEGELATALEETERERRRGEGITVEEWGREMKRLLAEARRNG